MKLVIQICLAVLIGFLGYKCYKSIDVPQKFTKLKNHRYEVVIQRLKDIRSAQEAYKGVKNVYASNFDDLISFIKNDSIKVVRSIGALTDEDLENGITEATAIKMGKIIRDTVRVAALTNVFSAGYPIEKLRYVPFTNEGAQFKLGATMVMTGSGLEVPVFEAKVSNMVIFANVMDEYKNEILQENGERERLKKYPGLKVGDIKEVNNNVGNWE